MPGAHDATAFDIIALTPWAGGQPAIAAAAANGGGIGVLDLEWARGADATDRACRQINWLIDHVATDATLGLRLAPSELERFAAALHALGARPSVVIFTRVPSADEVRAAAAPGRRCFVEIRSSLDITAMGAVGVGVDGLIACGNECGGRVGDDTTFVLVQRLLAVNLAPVYARGGIGLATATGCRVAGARGIVLDDQLLLTPESPLRAAWRQQLHGLTGQETVMLGTGAHAIRVFDRPVFAALAGLKRHAQAMESGDQSAADTWHALTDAALAWDEPATSVWPAGQAILLAERYRQRFGNTRAIIAHFAAETARRVRLAQTTDVLAPNAALAASHGTTYPIVQGPMTRVSDVPAFASAVAEAGALPLIALAVLTGDQARPVLEATRDALGARPWGVGVLGFVPAALKQAQLDEVRRVRPPFALVAGGRPDDAARLEADGIATYLHVPVASLLKRFLGQGATRFVFEGRECGGHVGPLCSFPLWESMVDALLDADLKDPSKVHVLFAGGIHDARSAAIVAGIAAPLAARGIRCGVLMGTAYLFTTEAVSSGAITARYQREAIECRDTVLLVSGVGHANRVAKTEFTAEYFAARRALLDAGQPADDIRDELEKLTLGRLRLATKGVTRRAADTPLVEASDAEQVAGGIYMLGQVATLRAGAVTMRALHDDVCAGATQLVHTAATAPAPAGADDDTRQIAIIGLATLVPGAELPDTLWRNLIDKTNAITEIPADRWDARLLYDADGHARDRMNSKWGGFFTDVPFDPIANRMPPAVLPQICSHQLLALEVTRWALADAGYQSRSFDRDNTAVIVGVAETGGLTGNGLITRTMMPFVLDQIPADALDRLPEWTGESFTGMLGNVTAGRIANQLDLGGANFCIDAACATSLLTLDLAAREIREGRASVAIAATVDTLQTPFGYMAFSKTQALSPTGQARVFDADADGIVSSEGVAVAILKTVAAARRDGDQIYAVLRGQGASADGRGLGLTAPAPAGQRRAISRALADAGVDITTLDMYEAHGTGTSLGDRTEIETLTGVLREAGASPRSCVVGSAKSLLGHTKAAAGLVGVIKATFALRHRTLPPHAGVTTPLPALADPSSPLALYDRPRPWFAPKGHPRRAGVNAFGFGGTNGSVVLEAADDTAPAGAALWPAELFLFGGVDTDALASALAHVHDALTAGAEPRLRDLAAALAVRVEEVSPGPRVSIVAGSRETLIAALADALRAVRAADGAAITLPPHIQLVRQARPSGAVAFVFPGQGAQTPHMALDQTLYFDDVRAAIELADDVCSETGASSLAQRMFPPAAFTPADADAERAAINATEYAQPAIGAISAGLLDLLGRLGVSSTMAAGHSYGELTALHASGALSRRDLFHLSAVRGRAMAACCGNGGMLALQCARERALALMDGVAGVSMANHNGPEQVVASGTDAGLAELRRRATDAGVRVIALPVAGAFHSPLMSAASEPWATALARTTFWAPNQTVYANVTAAPYGDDVNAMRDALLTQLQQPVEFAAEIDRMYQDGARVFVEVGPGTILTRLVGTILAGRPHLAVATDPAAGRLDGLLRTVGTLTAHGVLTEPSRLFLGRDIRPIAIDRLMELVPKPVAPTTWWVNGSGPRPSRAPKLGPARESLLTVETRNAHPAPVAAASPAPAVAADTNAVGMPAMMPASFSMPMAAPGASSAELVAAYAAYQDTMRAFLAVQEQVMRAFIGGAPAGTLPMAMTTPAAFAMPTMPNMPMTAAPQTPAMPVAPIAPASSVTTSTAAPAVAPAAPAPAAAASFDAQGLTARVLAVFAAQTGYPVEMLGLDMDLSSDLGVDSIRQVQALSELAESLPVGLKASATALADELMRLRTLRAIIDRLQPLVDASGASSAVAASAPSPVATSTSAPAEPTSSTTTTATTASLDRASLVKVLQQLASERTGYPPELLGAELDLEADLGVDSIRRADLLQSFLETLPSSVRPSPADADRVMHCRSIDRIVDVMLDIVGAATPAATPAEGPCPSFVSVDGEAPLDARRIRRTDGAVIVTEDEIGVTPLVVEAIERAGERAFVLSRADASSAERVAQRITSILADAGRVGAVLHLTSLSRTPVPHVTDDWLRRTQVDVKSLFQLLHALGTSDASVTSRLCTISASLMGGRYGRDGQLGPGAPTGGAAVGMLRCLDREWPGSSGRAIDFPGDMTTAEIAMHVVNEWQHADDHIEVGYPGGQRRAFGTAVTPRESGPADPALAPSDGWVVLATGGARGITAEAVEALARPGVTIILASRTPMPADASEPADQAALDATGLRQAFIRAAAARHERVTPVQIDARVTRVLHDRDLRRVRATLEATGARVLSQACDVSDGDALAALVRGIYDAHGRLDAVIHGAGVIEDSLVVNKTPASFDRVFDTKVNAAFALARAVRPEGLKLAVFFSSVSGRAGNAGQIDYAAANEVLSRMAWWLRGQWPQTRVVSIAWGPWAGQGMASEAVRARLRERGIEPIDAAAGRALLEAEMASSHGSDVELVAGIGPWDEGGPHNARTLKLTTSL